MLTNQNTPGRKILNLSGILAAVIIGMTDGRSYSSVISKIYVEMIILFAVILLGGLIGDYVNNIQHKEIKYERLVNIYNITIALTFVSVGSILKYSSNFNGFLTEQGITKPYFRASISYFLATLCILAISLIWELIKKLFKRPVIQ